MKLKRIPQWAFRLVAVLMYPVLLYMLCWFAGFAEGAPWGFACFVSAVVILNLVGMVLFLWSRKGLGLANVKFFQKTIVKLNILGFFLGFSLAGILRDTGTSRITGIIILISTILTAIVLYLSKRTDDKTKFYVHEINRVIEGKPTIYEAEKTQNHFEKQRMEMQREARTKFIHEIMIWQNDNITSIILLLKITDESDSHLDHNFEMALGMTKQETVKYIENLNRVRNFMHRFEENCEDKGVKEVSFA